MRLLLLAGFVCALSASASAAGGRTVSTSGLRMDIPAGWHARVAKTPNCDPERLIVASSEPVRFAANGGLATPASSDVLVVLLEDRNVHDRPVGDLRRPRHFTVSWGHLARVQGDCGLPEAPAFIRYFKSRSRYLGFIVYPGAHTRATTRAKTLALMDSLQVNT